MACKSAPGDNLPINLDDLGDNAAVVRNYAFASFWVQLPLTIVSACILIFALLYSKGVSDKIPAVQYPAAAKYSQDTVATPRLVHHATQLQTISRLSLPPGCLLPPCMFCS